MYKAIQAQTGEEIIILHPGWKKRIDRLREMDHADQLLCQGCQQSLRVKAGAVHRPHFAHKHLKACSYGTETAEILFARAVLYEWLLPFFGERVTVEKKIVESDLPRPVDCWVEKPSGALAYWIIETGIKLDVREGIKAAFQRIGVNVQWVFLSSMLHEERKEFHSLLLTPTERAFLKPSPYDELFAGLDDAKGSITYFNAEKNVLTTYRGLKLFHSPNWYKGVKKETDLANIRPDMTDGGFVYPGESAQLQGRREKLSRLEKKRKQYEARENAQTQRDTFRAREGWGIAANAEEAQGSLEKDSIREEETLPCVTCGKMTSEYWATFFDSAGRKLCRCRECLARESSE